METLLKSITRQPHSTTIAEIVGSACEGEEVTVVFKAIQKEQPKQSEPLHISGDHLRKGHEYIVRVKSWMTKPTVDDSFDFMRHWNNNIPMPLRVMRGRVLSDTRGMVYMELKAQPMQTDRCMKCGKTLTHPVSRLYGLGPECGGHYHINPFETEEELNAALEEVHRRLNNVTWTGWIAKSGVEYATEVLPNGEVASKPV